MTGQATERPGLPELLSGHARDCCGSHLPGVDRYRPGSPARWWLRRFLRRLQAAGAAGTSRGSGAPSWPSHSSRRRAGMPPERW